MHPIILVFIAAFSVSAFAENQSFEDDPLVAPIPIIDFIDLGRSQISLQKLHPGPQWVCVIGVPEPVFNFSNSQLVLEFVGTKETWIPINGKAKKEYLFRAK